MIFDFRCPRCNHVHEEWVKTGTTTATCPKCFTISNRIITGGSFALDPLSGDFPTATQKWAIAHEQGAKKNTE